ncbi:MAG: amino acid permease [Gammaproteobacteria bacterium]|nr:amino acid permease [Gammaproteobacteria bacterium]
MTDASRPEANTSTADAGAPSSETRALGFWTCAALVVGNTIGVGVFLMPASLAPYGLNALPAWGITTVGCVVLAMVFSGLARTYPADDGPYAYTQRAFGSGTSFYVLWCYWVSTWVTNATIAIGVVGYLTILVPSLQSTPWLPPVVSLSLLWLFVLINCLGIRTAGWMQMVTTVLKLLPLVGIVILGIWQLIVHPSVYVAHVPPNPVSLQEVMAASTIALYAMLGIECAMIPAGKVIDPARTIPRATIVGTVATALICMSVSIVPMLLIPQAQLSTSNAPFADLFGQYLGAQYGPWLALFIVISGLGALNGWTLVVGELTQAFARHGNFPAALGKVNSRAAPVYAFLLTGVAASITLWFNYNASMTKVFTFLSVLVTAANLPLYLACSLAVLVLWRQGKIMRVGLRELTWFAAALLALVYCVWVFVGMHREDLLWALALAAAGIPFHIWAVWARRNTASSNEANKSTVTI